MRSRRRRAGSGQEVGRHLLSKLRGWPASRDIVLPQGLSTGLFGQTPNPRQKPCAPPPVLQNQTTNREGRQKPSTTQFLGPSHTRHHLPNGVTGAQVSGGAH